MEGRLHGGRCGYFLLSPGCGAWHVAHSQPASAASSMGLGRGLEPLSVGARIPRLLHREIATSSEAKAATGVKFASPFWWTLDTF